MKCTRVQYIDISLKIVKFMSIDYLTPHIIKECVILFKLCIAS